MVGRLNIANLALLDPMVKLVFHFEYGSIIKLQAALTVEIKINHNPTVQNLAWALS